MLLPILQDGDPLLRQVAQPVPEGMFGTPELDRILTDMSETLDGQVDGVALAAPQVGISFRIFIVRYDRMNTREGDVPEDLSPEVGVYINPEFVKSSKKRDEMQEGCLSVRGIYGTTLRSTNATMRAQDERGVWFERGGGGILAQAFQHETDHLDGILFIDHAEEIHEQTREDETEHGTEPA